MAQQICFGEHAYHIHVMDVMDAGHDMSLPDFIRCWVEFTQTSYIATPIS